MKLLLERFARLPILLEAAAWLTLAWLALDVLPGRLYRRLLPPSTVPDRAADSEVSETSCRRATVRIAWSVERAGNLIPFRCVCFHRGIAAYNMLRRRGLPSSLHYGVAHTEGTQALKAHVWVSSNGCDVVGGSVKDQFREIARFSPDAARDLMSARTA